MRRSRAKRPITPDVVRRFFDATGAVEPSPAAGAGGPIALSDYMCPARFPLTTQVGLTPRDQFLADAFALGRVREYLAGGGALTDAQRAWLAELEAKAEARPALAAQLANRGPQA